MNLPVMDYRQWTPLQGRLKDLTDYNYNRLKGLLQKRGFDVPAFLWFNKADQKYYLLDGHQRQFVLNRENAQPHELPYVLIQAADFKEAKERLLEITSQYGTITQEGLDEFAFDLDLPAMGLNFDKLPDFSAPLPPAEPDPAADEQEPEPDAEVPAAVVVVTCKDPAEQTALASELQQRGLPVRLASVKMDEKSLSKILQNK